MSWRTVVVRNRAKLDYKMNYMVITSSDDKKRVHISEINTLIVESTAVSITAVLINELVKNKVKIIFCDEKRNPSSELISYYGSHNTSECYREQVKWSSDIKKRIWKIIVQEKIRNQSILLKYIGKEEYRMLDEYVNQVELNDITNREGHAAKVYFNSIFGNEFSRREENNINAILNYGYSILLSAINREIVALGYMTQLGIFHNNMFNQFNLSSDLIEPFRVLIDKKAFEKRKEEINLDTKMYMVSTLSESILYCGKNTTVDTAIKMYCRDMMNALNQEDDTLLFFPEINFS